MRHAEFKGLLRSGGVYLSQFSHIPDVANFTDEFLWREYFIYVSLEIASSSRDTRQGMNLVECGVCDGWTSWFAMKRATDHAPDAMLWAYDSWNGMRQEDLLASESKSAGNYAYLSLDQTRLNLRCFGDAIQFCPGYLPDSFGEFHGPEVVHWLHIDLNSAQPTVSSLKHFWARIPEGGVVLLDDYDWPGYEDTKILSDEFFHALGQWVVALPTGQGLVIKK